LKKEEVRWLGVEPRAPVTGSLISPTVYAADRVLRAAVTLWVGMSAASLQKPALTALAMFFFAWRESIVLVREAATMAEGPWGSGPSSSRALMVSVRDGGVQRFKIFLMPNFKRAKASRGW
jgi:hypothetical protein